MKTINILGIHDGHNSGATLCRDGVIVASVSEERLTRQKNEVGYPARSIENVLHLGGIKAEHLTEVTYASNFMHHASHLKDISDWYILGLKDQLREKEKPADYQKLIFEERRKQRIEQVVKHIGVAPEIVTFVEHHRAHLAAAYYTAPNALNRPILGLTCDGAGDGLCATVSVCEGNNFGRIAVTDRHASLGKIYSRVTVLMGMKAWEHEFKVMGMAPYADKDYVDRALPVFKNLLKLSSDGLRFEQVGELSTNFCYEYLKENLERVRFDTICGAVQQFTEDMMLEWVRACINNTGIRDIVAGGGVFMNVKANMRIAQMPEVNSFYVMPSAGDESLSIGACLDRYYQITGKTDHSNSAFDNLYLGGEFTKTQEQEAFSTVNKENYNIIETNDPDQHIADLLVKGQIVARCMGRMEWGARSLGNRSILVRGDNLRNVEVLNNAIKMRDFWMPFAPSIREEAAPRYYDDTKGIQPQFMTFSMPGSEKAQSDLIAGSHPRDHTLRVQFVREKANPKYHRLLTLFEEKTGMGGFVNTSFNLHGEPVVYSPADALRVLSLSGLNHMALNNFIISKKRA